jgi:hypothetical protein
LFYLTVLIQFHFPLLQSSGSFLVLCPFFLLSRVQCLWPLETDDRKVLNNQSSFFLVHIENLCDVLRDL